MATGRSVLALRRLAGGSFNAVPRCWMQTSCATDVEGTGLVIGIYVSDGDTQGKSPVFTKAGEAMNQRTNGALMDMLRMTGPPPRKGENRILYGLTKDFSAIVVVGMGDDCVSYNDNEVMDEYKESVRCAAATGCRALQTLHVKTIYVESFGHAESAAEGAAMGVWLFQELKNKEKQRIIPILELHDDCDYTGWQIGLQKAAAQNLARQLCETPANLMTPTVFAQSSVEILCKAGVNVEVKVRQWAKIMEMEGFLAASRGSCEPPIFMEASYYGCDPDVAPVVLIGKGVTFDSGGLCLKDFNELKTMRGDMAGAAVVVAVLRAVSALQLPINVRALVPLSENLPGSCAMKPGDILRAKNGKTIVIEDTDFDGRLGLADALCYSANFNPKFVLDIGTLSRELKGMMGSTATAVFSNNDQLFENMRVASIHTGDRIWRFPLWKHYTNKVTTYPGSDLGERYRTSGAPCSAAAFLHEFVPGTDWIHLDTFNVMMAKEGGVPYLRGGMSGRPTRTVIEFLAQLACRGSADGSQAEDRKPC